MHIRWTVKSERNDGEKKELIGWLTEANCEGIKTWRT